MVGGDIDHTVSTIDHSDEFDASMWLGVLEFNDLAKCVRR